VALRKEPYEVTVSALQIKVHFSYFSLRHAAALAYAVSLVCLSFMAIRGNDASADIITAFTNTDLFFAQEQCELSRSLGDYEYALEWGRSGLLVALLKNDNVSYRAVLQVLMNCIQQSKLAVAQTPPTIESLQGIQTAPASGADFKSRLARLPLNELVWYARALRESGSFARGQSALQDALNEVVTTTDPRSASTLEWNARARYELARMEYELGNFEAALALANESLSFRKTLLNAPPIYEEYGLIGLSLAATKRWDEALSSFKNMFEVLTTSDVRLASDSPFSRPENFLSRSSAELSVYMRALYEKSTSSTGQSSRDAVALAFFIAQYASLGTISQSFEDLVMREAAPDTAGDMSVETFQNLREEYLSGMLRIEDELQNRFRTGNTSQKFTLAELRELQEQRVELNQFATTLDQGNVTRSSELQLSLDQAMDRLANDETLLLYYEAPQQHDLQSRLFRWTISNDSVDWTHVELPPNELSELVLRLRCGVDPELASSNECRGNSIQNSSATDDAEGLPAFDIDTAQQLYSKLLATDERIAPKSKLLIVPSPSMVALPFAALVQPDESAPAAISDFSQIDIPWLALTHSHRILPSVSVLAREVENVSAEAGKSAILGFANPLLLGTPESDPRHTNWARTAELWHRCAGEREFSIAGTEDNEASSDNEARQLARLSALTPLPESAQEVCTVAKESGSPASEVYLGRNAKESAVKTLSLDGRLRSFDVLHIASHALYAGELPGFDEPGIVLTPPRRGSPEDNGFLSTSEIEELDLDAELVVLSACNTARSEIGSAAMLKGLADSFFQAGAKRLIVSHWATNSDAATVILPLTMRNSPGGSYDRGLQVAQETLIRELRSHPFFWAQFFVVG